MADGKLFAGEILLTSPGSDISEVPDYARTILRIFLDRNQLNCMPPFAQCLFLLPQSGIDHPKHT